jgi:uncharacterized spore protein YtfJ
LSNNAQDILGTILERLKGIANSETVVGDPVTVGDITLLPVVKISVGFAAGAGEGTGGDEKQIKGTGGGGGGGGGASVTPVGFICYDGSDVKFIPVGKGTFDSIIDSVPELIKKFGLGKKPGKAGAGAEEG